MENPESVLMELNAFEKDTSIPLSKILEEYLIFIAKTGNTVFPWPKIKPLVRAKLDSIIEDFNTAMPEDQVPKMPNVDTFKFTEMKQRIFEQLESYSGIPFTMQRLCELLTKPTRHYKRVDKFMRGLEKVMLVVSTIDPTALGDEEGSSVKDKVEERVERENDRDTEREKERDNDSITMESPSKRIRLSSENIDTEEDSGPCDSQDGVSTARQIEPPSVETEATVSTASTLSSSPTENTEVESMDIDTECTSSETRLSVQASNPVVEDSEETACDSGNSVTTTAPVPTPNLVKEPEEACSVQPSSTEGEPPSSLSAAEETEVEVPTTEDDKVPDCSSSDQAVTSRESISPTNSEAEPAEEVAEEATEDLGKEETIVVSEENPSACVESSEEAGQTQEETGGAADSSNEVIAGVDNDHKETEEKTEEDVSKKDEEETSSPDQSDTV